MLIPFKKAVPFKITDFNRVDENAYEEYGHRDVFGLGRMRVPPRSFRFRRVTILNNNQRRVTVFSSSSGLSSLSPSSRETVDPIAELLSQLSGVRRSATNTSVGSTSTPTQLQQLQMQLQLERQQVSARQQLERLPRRQTPSQTNARDTNPNVPSQTSNMLLSTAPPTASAPMAQPTNHFLLDGLLESMKTRTLSDEERLFRTTFIQQLIISSLTKRKEKISLKKEPALFAIEAAPAAAAAAPAASATAAAEENSKPQETATPPKAAAQLQLAGRGRVRGRGRSNGQVQLQVQKARAPPSSKPTTNPTPPNV